MPECTTHHHACACREAMFKELDRLYEEIVGHDDGWLEYKLSMEQLTEIYTLREKLGLDKGGDA